MQSSDITIEPAQVTGVQQIGRGIRGHEEVITLEFVVFWGIRVLRSCLYHKHSKRGGFDPWRYRRWL